MKKVVIVLMTLFILVIVSGCKQQESELYKPGVKVLECNYTQAIIIDKETGVQYLFIDRSKGCGLTVRLNSDGKPMTIKDLKK